MAGAIALLPAIMGGAGTAASGVSAMGVISGLAGIASAGMTIAGAKQSADMADYQAKVAEVNGRRQAVAINDDLLKSLSMNNAAAAASGLQGTGSVQAAQEASQAAAAEQLSVNTFNTSQRVTDAKQQSSNAFTSGVSQALNTGVGVLGDVYNRSNKVKKTG